MGNRVVTEHVRDDSDMDNPTWRTVEVNWATTLGQPPGLNKTMTVSARDDWLSLVAPQFRFLYLYKLFNQLNARGHNMPFQMKPRLAAAYTDSQQYDTNSSGTWRIVASKHNQLSVVAPDYTSNGFEPVEPYAIGSHAGQYMVLDFYHDFLVLVRLAHNDGAAPRCDVLLAARDSSDDPSGIALLTRRYELDETEFLQDVRIFEWLPTMPLDAKMQYTYGYVAEHEFATRIDFSRAPRIELYNAMTQEFLHAYKGPLPGRRERHRFAIVSLYDPPSYAALVGNVQMQRRKYDGDATSPTGDVARLVPHRRL